MAESRIHTKVIQIIAYDPDSVNAIEYSLSRITFKSNAGSDQAEDDAFTIDQDTGWVYTNKFHYMEYTNGYFATTVVAVGDGKQTRRTLQVLCGIPLLPEIK